MIFMVCVCIYDLIAWVWCILCQRFVCLSVCLSVYLSVCLSCLSVCLWAVLGIVYSNKKSIFDICTRSDLFVGHKIVWCVVKRSFKGLKSKFVSKILSVYMIRDNTNWFWHQCYSTSFTVLTDWLIFAKWANFLKTLAKFFNWQNLPIWNDF